MEEMKNIENIEKTLKPGNIKSEKEAINELYQRWATNKNLSQAEMDMLTDITESCLKKMILKRIDRTENKLKNFFGRRKSNFLEEMKEKKVWDGKDVELENCEKMEKRGEGLLKDENILKMLQKMGLKCQEETKRMLDDDLDVIARDAPRTYVGAENKEQRKKVNNILGKIVETKNQLEQIRSLTNGRKGNEKEIRGLVKGMLAGNGLPDEDEIKKMPDDKKKKLLKETKLEVAIGNILIGKILKDAREKNKTEGNYLQGQNRICGWLINEDWAGLEKYTDKWYQAMVEKMALLLKVTSYGFRELTRQINNGELTDKLIDEQINNETDPNMKKRMKAEKEILRAKINGVPMKLFWSGYEFQWAEIDWENNIKRMIRDGENKELKRDEIKTKGKNMVDWVIKTMHDNTENVATEIKKKL